MEVIELFLSCRKGDLKKIQKLVENRNVNVNIRDKWDSTPLYYACLCGHISVVEYLIEVGAKCEANTFDGERCLYGALTNDIKRTLLQHSMITSHIIRRNEYQEFLRRLYESDEGSDVSFVYNDETFKLHRCILSARSSYFATSFGSKWINKEKIFLHKELLDKSAFNVVVKYIYTGIFECSLEMTDNCLLIAKQCKLPFFKEKLDKALKRDESFQVEKQGRVKVTRVVIEPEDADSDISVESNLFQLALMTLPPSFNRVWSTEMPFSPFTIPFLADVCFLVNGLTFLCHKVFFSTRSDYFKTLFKYHLKETTNEELLTIEFNDISANNFEAIIIYLYANQFMISEDNVCELLMAANMYLLPGLVRQCGVVMGKHVSLDNVMDVHNISRVYELPKLEDQCVAFIANNFYHMADQESFRNLIMKDAANIRLRQETDSVTVIDELRYHISSHLNNMSDIEDAKGKLTRLENILEDLGIEA